MSYEDADLVPDFIQKRWATFLFAGLLLVLGSLYAGVAPLAAGVAVTTLTGAALGVAGLFQAIHAFTIKRWVPFGLSFAFGLLVLAAGLALLYNPVAAVTLLTVTLAGGFVLAGLCELALALWLRPLPVWRWEALSALVSLLAGGLIFVQYKTAAAGLIGFYTGAGLLTSGISLISLALAGRRAARQVAAEGV